MKKTYLFLVIVISLIFLVPAFSEEPADDPLFYNFDLPGEFGFLGMGPKMGLSLIHI